MSTEIKEKPEMGVRDDQETCEAKRSCRTIKESVELPRPSGIKVESPFSLQPTRNAELSRFVGYLWTQLTLGKFNTNLVKINPDTLKPPLPPHT